MVKTATQAGALLSTREVAENYWRLAKLLRGHALIAEALAEGSDIEPGPPLERQAAELDAMGNLLWEAKARIDLEAL